MATIRRGGRRTIPAALLLCTVLIPTVASAETVVARRRLGNNVEALTYDPLLDRAYALDGNDVIAIPFNPLDAALATFRDGDGDLSGTGFRKVFDVLALDPLARTPKGIVYVPAQGRFYFSSLSATQFFSSDARGRPLPTLDVKGLGDTSDWSQWEGLAWIPASAPAHGGTIAALGMRTNLSHVFYVRLDGTVEAEVVPQAGTPLENYFCGLQYWPRRPGTLLLTGCSGTYVYAMDMRTGALVGDPNRSLVMLPEAGDVEGVVVRRNGQILFSGYETGRLYAFDPALDRTPGDDRLFVVGLGASVRRLAWNTDTAELVTTSPLGERVFAVSPDLRSARLLFDVAVNHEIPEGTGGIAYLGQGQVAIGTRGFRRGIDVADLGTGYSISRLMFFPPGFPGTVFNPRGVGAYGPDAFLVNSGDRGTLKVVSRSGVPDPSFYPDGVLPARLADLTLSVPTLGAEAQLFDSGTGPRIFTGAEIYDASGAQLHVIDASQLGIQNPPLSSGVWMYGNTFAAVDGFTSTVIVYTVP